MTSPAYDPDNDLPPVYDDRPERVVRIPDPVVQQRNRLSKRRGKRAERRWADLIADIMGRFKNLPAEITPPEVRGGLGGADVVWWRFAFECKQRRGDWPTSTVIRDAVVQAKRNAGWRMPVVVACKTGHKSTEWRVYTDTTTEGMYWIGFVIAEAIAI